jgi:integrase
MNGHHNDYLTHQKKFNELLSEVIPTTDESSEMKKTKNLSWNAPTTKDFSQNCLNYSHRDHNDIKKVSKESMVNILSTLVKVYHNYSNMDQYMGPEGIVDWFWVHLVKENISSKKLLKYLSSKKHLNPVSYYTLYQLIMKFLNFCSEKLNTSVLSIDDKQLKREFFTSFIASDKCKSSNDKNKINKIFKLFFRGELLQYETTQNENSKPLNHPLINCYFDFLLKKGLKTRTVLSNYYYDCEYFLFWLRSTFTDFCRYDVNSIPFHLINETHLHEFKIHLLNELKKGNLSERSISTRLYIVRALFSTLYQINKLSIDITTNVIGISFEKYRYRKIPDDEQIGKFFLAVNIYSPDPLRDRLAFGLMLYLGFRIGEVIKVEWEDISLEKQSIIVRGKGGKLSLLPLPKVLKDLFTTMKTSNISGRVFCQKKSGFDMYLQYYFKFYTLIAGWNEGVSLHLLRHTFITNISKIPNCPPQVIIALSRHERPETTSLYIHREDSELSEAINKIKFER